MMEPEFVLKVHQNELLSLKSQMNLRRENVSCSARKLVEFCLDMTPKVRTYILQFYRLRLIIHV